MKNIKTINEFFNFKEHQYTYDDMLKAAKYGFEYKRDAIYKDDDFENGCKENFSQFLEELKDGLK